MNQASAYESAVSPSTAAIMHPRRWLSFGAVFGPGIYLLLIAYALFNGSTGHLAGPIGYVALFGLLWYASYAVRRRYPRTASFVRFMLPIVLYGAFYGQVHAMIAALRPQLIDETLAAIDRRIFGIDPIAWLGHHGHPLITDVLFLSYFTYYLGMPVLLILMWKNSPEHAFRTVLASLVICWYGALITYGMFPALGPNRFMPGSLPQLHGWLPTTEWIQTFLRMNLPNTVRDSIPSLHTAVTLLALTFAYQYQRRFFKLYLPPGIGLILATMYTQQHYVIDVFLGVITFALIYLLVTKLKLQ